MLRIQRFGSLALALGALLFAATPAAAGPIFQLVAQTSNTLPHPSGLGTRVASDSWGISTTGGGWMDGTIEFVNGFALPGVGGVSVFDETDLVRVAFRHTESAFAGGGTPVPGILVEATNTPGGAQQIASAVGQVVGGGTAENPTWTINFLNQSPTDPNPPIITHVETTLFVFLCCGAGGVFTGNFAIDGRTFVLHDALRAGDVNRIDVAMRVSSQADGQWLLTSVPEPGAAALLGLAAFAWGIRRR